MIIPRVRIAELEIGRDGCVVECRFPGMSILLLQNNYGIAAFPQIWAERIGYMTFTFMLQDAGVGTRTVEDVRDSIRRGIRRVDESLEGQRVQKTMSLLNFPEQCRIAEEYLPKFLGAFGMLTEKGAGFLQRDICEQDREKPSSDEILQRAFKRKGLGWDLGRRQEMEAQRAPHTRRGHWAVRWMKPKEGEKGIQNGLVPRLRPIKPAVVGSVNVPTGYEDQE